MTQPTDIEAFRAGLSGTARARGDNGYDEARSAWNGEIDRYPAVIARCRSAADVGAAIEYARQRDLEISVRGGFHNTAGTAMRRRPDDRSQLDARGHGRSGDTPRTGRRRCDTG